MKKNGDQPHAPREKTLKNGNRRGNPQNAPRCGAKTRKSLLCIAPAMLNGRCRMHGGLSTGPKTLEGQTKARRGNWKHGNYSAEAKEEGRRMRDFFKDAERSLEKFKYESEKV